MFNRILINILAILILGTVYISNIFIIDSNIGNLIISLSIFFIFIIWSLVNNAKFDYSKLLLLLVTIIIIALTQKANLSSLSLLILLLIQISNSTVHIKSNIKIYTIISVIFFLCMCFLYFVFNVNANLNINMWRINKIIYRETLGFSHPNQAMIAWLGVSLSLLSFCTKRNAFYLCSITAIFTVIVYNFTISRTATYILLVLCLNMFLFRRKLEEEVNVLVKYFFSMIPILYMLISIVIIKLPYNTVVDSFVSGRMSLYKQFFYESGVTLFGNASLENAMFDNGYLQALLAKGLLFTILWLIILTYMIMKSKKTTWNDLFIIIGYLTCGLAETMLFKFELLLLIVLVLYKSNKKNYLEKNLIR